MFHHALRASGSAPLDDLGQVSLLSRRVIEERSTFLFRSQAPCLEYVSLLIESALLLKIHRTGRVYVGFQKLSQMKDVIDRYLRIADLSERVYVFGECDWKPPRHPNMRLIGLAQDVGVAREWFVIADSPALQIALVAVDEDGLEVPVLEERHFRALKSSDPAIVTQLSAAAEELVDSSLAA